MHVKKVHPYQKKYLQLFLNCGHSKIHGKQNTAKHSQD